MPILPLPSDLSLTILRSMTLAREGDLRENVLVRQGKGSFGLSSAGHEGIAALAPSVQAGDMVFPAYRDKALMHGLGMGVEDLARDFFAREGSESGGRNLPSHFSSRALGVFSLTSPVGAQCLPAVGAAWAFKLSGEPSVAFCHIGDAATRQGEFFEAVAQAVQDRLPVIFVVEDNGYGISTPTRGTTPLALGMLPEDHVVRVDARDPVNVYRAGAEAAAAARAGGGPRILWCDLDRLSNHTSADDHRVYRTLADIDAMIAGDPLEILSSRLIGEGLLTLDGWSEMRKAVATEVRDAYLRVETEPSPCPECIEEHLFAPPKSRYPSRAKATPETTMLGSVNGVLREALAAIPKVVLFGEDVEDPKGGVFGLTKGLSTLFPGRVVNSPLAEATIAGTAVGLAAAGYRPVFELQFVDFAGPALNQLTAQAANLRWRTKGAWSCPLVLYAPYGAYLPGGGMWHSQSNEGLFANVPGLRIAVPSTGADAAGLLWAAMHDDDPSLVLLPKHLLRAETPPAFGQALAWGKGRVVREGTDATIVAWGNGVEVAEAACRLLDASVEIIDLRTLVPCDWDLVADSVLKTGRLVVVQEDAKTGGFGQTVIAEVTARAFASLRAAPVLVARPDVPVPFSPVLEMAILPSAEGVAYAVRTTMADRAVSAPIAEKAAEDHGHVTLTVPQLGEGLRRVRVTAHLKRVGERVLMDEPLYEVETDKANVAVESPAEGIVAEWCVPVGEEADVHGPIARLVAEGVPVPVAPKPLERGGFTESPLSERQRAMNRSAVGGRLDVPIPASVGRPIAWDLVEAARARLRTLHPRLRPTEFGVFAYAVARASAAHPKFRSSLVARGETVRLYDHLDLGFAVALPNDELATAVVRGADRLSAEEFGQALRERHREAKSGASGSDARTTLLLSSLVGHDVVDAAPVLFPPAIATLFLGAPHDGPTRREANLRLAFDHRLINGVGAAAFLQGIEETLTALGTA